MSTVIGVRESPGGHVPESRGRHRGLLVTAVVLVVVLVGVGIWFAAGREDSPAQEFDFSTDSVCDWFSAEDMNQIVATAQKRVGTKLVVAPFQAGDCDEGELHMWVAWPPSGNSDVIVVLTPVANGVDSGWERTTEPDDFVGHHLLDDTVTYGNLERLVWYLPGMAADFRVDGHEDEVLWFALLLPGTSGPGPSDDRHELLGFAVADAMLRDMNWID